MKVILDTNVFVSGIFWDGPPNAILRAWNLGKLHLVLSSEILEEYKRIAFKTSLKFPGVDLAPFITLLSTQASIYNAPALPQVLCEDPDDDKFLACAMASKVSLIVTGNKALLKLSGYQDILILKPKDFVQQYLKTGAKP